MGFNLAELTPEDVIENPNKFGLPTFKEFSLNPKKWLDRLFGTEQDFLAMLDESSKALNKHEINTRKFAFKGYVVNSITELQKVAHDHGVRLTGQFFEPRIEALNQGGGRCEFLVRVVSKGQKGPLLPAP